MLQVVMVERTNDGGFTLTYGGREINVSRARFESLAQTDPSTYRALKYSQGSALLQPGKAWRLDEKIAWDRYLNSDEGRRARARLHARGES